MHAAPLTVQVAGEGRPAVILHGGGGPLTVLPISEHLADSMRAITPTLPGWDGEPRPDAITSVPDLAAACAAYLEQEDLTDVLVVGSSVGGWIASELAVNDREGRISGVVILDGAGIAVEGEPMTDVFRLDARGIAEKSFHDADRFYVDPATQSPEERATFSANLDTLRAVAGDPYMHDPGLRDRLGDVQVPVLVIWGDSDGIFTPDYGRAYAASFPNATFALVKEAGHLPQLEQPAATMALIDRFAAS